jgi:hypothetical protein
LLLTSVSEEKQPQVEPSIIPTGIMGQWQRRVRMMETPQTTWSPLKICGCLMIWMIAVSIHSILCDWFKLSLCDEITMLALIQVLIIFRICSINVWESQVQPPGNSIPIGQETMKVASKIRDLPERRNTWPKPMGRGSLILWINAVSYNLSECTGSSSASSNAQGSGKWYIDWSTFQCVTDSAGQLADEYGKANLHSTQSKCCETYVSWDYKNCMKGSGTDTGFTYFGVGRCTDAAGQITLVMYPRLFLIHFQIHIAWTTVHRTCILQ